MPTYDYRCKDCGSEFEVFHGMNEKPEVVCASCEGKHTEKMISSGAGIIFKGSGFYETDYVKKSGGPSESKAEKTESKPSGGGCKSGCGCSAH